MPQANLTAEREHLAKLVDLLSGVYSAHARLNELQEQAVKIVNTEEAAFFYKDEVNSAMEELRRYVDALETITARDYWPVPTYGDMTYGGIL